MTSGRSLLLRTMSMAASGVLLTVCAALAQDKGQTNSPVSGIPTLDGFGLATLAGVLSVGGAWLLSRRDKEK